MSILNTVTISIYMYMIIRYLSLTTSFSDDIEIHYDQYMKAWMIGILNDWRILWNVSNFKTRFQTTLVQFSILVYMTYIILLYLILYAT
jgi:hypothetical protein